MYETAKTKSLVGSFISRLASQRYFANTLWLIVGKVVNIVVTFLVGICVVRYLRPEGFGVLSYSMSIVTLFSVVASLELDLIVIRELVMHPNQRNELMGTAFMLKLVGSFLTLIAINFAFLFVHENAIINTIVLILATGLIFQSFNVIDFYFQAKVLSRYVVFSQLTSVIIVSIAKMIFIYLKLPLTYFASAVILESIIFAAGLIISFKQQNHNIFEWRFNRGLAISLLKNCWPMILTGLCMSIYMRVDQIMIKQMLDVEAVGQYAAAVRLSEAGYFMPVVLCNSFFPAILNAKNTSKKLYYDRLQKLYALMIWIAIPVAFVITLAADRLVPFLYGKEFLGAASVLKIHIWAGVFVFLGTASNRWLLAENFVKILLFRTSLGCIANIVFNYFAIPRYGLLGAAYGALLANILATYLFDILHPKTRIAFVMKTKAFAYMFMWKYWFVK
jgi:O-antigen/teichoic acid export membrane protein